MIDASLQRDFDAVCANESFDRYRDFEIVLGRVARAIVAGWSPRPCADTPVSAQRAGYLLTVLADRGAPVKPPAAPSAPLTAVPFFHADPVPSECHDALARRWGLTRGLQLARLAQLLTPPFAA